MRSLHYMRWIAATPLGIAFLVGLLAVLVLLRLNGTFLNPAFYPDQLEKADIYRFVMADVLESAFDEARQLQPEELGVDFRKNALAASGLDTPQLTAAVQEA